MRHQSTFAAALLLILASPLALAAKPDCDTDPTHPSCDDGSGDPNALPYLVQIQGHPGLPAPVSPLYQPYDLDSGCLAEAHDGLAQLNIVFLLDDLGCATLTTDEGNSVLPSLGIDVIRDKKTGAITSAWFRGRAESLAHAGGEMVNVQTYVVEHGDGSFTIHLHADGVLLNKCDTHDFKRKTVCEVPKGYFAVDDLHYRPNPAY